MVSAIGMKPSTFRLTIASTLAGALALGGIAACTDGPERGGTLRVIVPAEPPSFDAHQETTFTLVQAIGPFYSTLVMPNPENPGDPTDFVCDLCVGGVPEPTDGGTVYTFGLREDALFHDGTPVTAVDVKASLDKIIDPPDGVRSPRKAHFGMVESIDVRDEHTVVFRLAEPSGAFLPALANPFNFIYPKARLDRDIRWFERNILGSGPFRLAGRAPGSFVSGTRFDAYYMRGRPYLDGFRAIFASSMAEQIEAIRTGRADIQFRGFPPAGRDELVDALGEGISVQEGDWDCVLLVVPNPEREPFDDVRVRRALTLAIDRWGASSLLSRVATVKPVGGIVFPGHPLAATREELERIAGYWPDPEESRAEARRLLEEAGVGNLSFELHNRAVEQPHEVAGAWLVEQWRQIGLDVEQRLQPTGPYYAALRGTKDYDVAMEFECGAVVNPLLDTARFASADLAQGNDAGRTDREAAVLYRAMLGETDPVKQREAMRAYETYILDEVAHRLVMLWGHRIVPHRSHVRGWGIGPSHYVGNHLLTVWLDE